MRASRVGILVGLFLPWWSCAKPLKHALDLDIEVRPRGHQDAVVQEDGSLKPHWFGSTRKIGLCLDVPVSIDTSQWQMGLRFSGAEKERVLFEGPWQQAGTTLCFGQTPPIFLPSTPDLEVCGVLRDGLEERFYRIPCFRALYEKDASSYTARRDAVNALAANSSQMSIEQLVDEFESFASTLEAEGYPLQAFRLRLALLYHLRNEGTPESFAEIDRQLDALPPWLEDRAATELKVSALYEQALFERQRGRRRRAWRLLEDAAELAQQTAVSFHISLRTRQAEILAMAGGARESIDRLHDVLENCDRWSCNESLIPSTHHALAWLLLIDPDISPQELEQARRSLEIGATAETAQDESETANQRISEALLALRQQRAPQGLLAEARSILEQRATDSRSYYLLAWADVVEGLAALQEARPRRALDLCLRPATGSPVPMVSAWAWSCRGQAHRQLGELAAAALAFEQAILRHTLATPDLGQDFPVSPGQRADDYYRAARVAIERREMVDAWHILESLDLLALNATTACEDQSETIRSRLEMRRQRLLEQLAWTEPPFAPDRERQLEPVRRSIMESLEELQRTMLSECHRPLEKAPSAADLRAFALADEVIVLSRSSEGAVAVVRQSPLARRTVQDLTDRLAAAQSTGDLGDEAWRELARPLAKALVPPHVETLGAVTRFALHGVLQAAPLSALPVEAPGGRWLGEFTTPVLQPAVVEETARGHHGDHERVPLFVVDPLRNLASGQPARAMYRERFPRARILYGSKATLAAVRHTLREASFLHIDAHGRFNSTFPSLSGLSLADGAMSLADFARSPVPKSFVNLSGCDTGSSLQTGNSGHYGLAGAVARRGVRWVVANRGIIQDRLGHDFNEVFYREIAQGQEVPQAYHSAMEALRAEYPAAAWSNLLLLGSGGGAMAPTRGLPAGERRG